MLARIVTPQAWNSDTQLGVLYNLIWNGGLGIGEPSIDAALERQKRSNWTNAAADTRATEKVENWIVSNITEFQLSDNYSIKNIFGYRNLDSTTSNDADGTNVPVFGSLTSSTEFYTVNPLPGGTNASQYSEELQFLGNSFDNRLDWIAGVYWMQMQGSEVLWANLPGPYPGWPGSGIAQIDAVANQGLVQTSPNANADNEAWAVYGEGTWRFNEEWSVTGGARQTWDYRKIEAMNYGFNQDELKVDCGMFDQNGVRLPFGPECVRSEDHDFEKLTGRGSVNWTPTDDLLVYFSVASGYRTGGFNARGTNNFTLQPYDDETVVSYELGNKADWNLMNFSSFRTNLAIYYQDYKDIQKTVAQINPDTGAFESPVINAAKAEIWGGEFDITIAPTANLVINLGYAFVDAEYKDWPRLVETGEIVDYTQANFLYVPKNSATGSVNYTLALPGDWGQVNLNASGYWQDKMWTNDDPWRWPELGWSDENLQEALATVKTDSYYVWNFRVDWMNAMGSGFDVAAFINNAFDEDYITGGLSVPEDLGWIAASYGPPRTYGASLRYSF
jgi:iron complex outermembrane receptor protein